MSRLTFSVAALITVQDSAVPLHCSQSFTSTCISKLMPCSGISPTLLLAGIIMLNWALTFFIVALIAGALGFGGIAGDASWIAYVLFVIFLVLFLVSLLTGRRVPPV